MTSSAQYNNREIALNASHCFCSPIDAYHRDVYRGCLYYLTCDRNTLSNIYITRNIIAPLGLNSTTYDVSHAEQFGTLADGFVTNGVGGERIFKPIPYWTKRGGQDFLAGPGGVISNVKDLVCVMNYLAL